MSSVNKIILMGRLGADPEIRQTQGGQTVCNLRLATSENWKDKAGNRQERTEWHNVTVWGKQGESCGQYLKKGRQVYIEGRIQSREYTDREGHNRKAWDVVANQVVFLSGQSEQGQQRQAQNQRGPHRQHQGRPSGDGWDRHEGQGRHRTEPGPPISNTQNPIPF